MWSKRLQAIPYTTNFKATGSSWNMLGPRYSLWYSKYIYALPWWHVLVLQLKALTARRLTAGWTDDTMSAKVVLDDNTGGLNKYLAGDQMKITTTASINSISLDNLIFRFNL